MKKYAAVALRASFVWYTSMLKQ